jgi:hypothetical protein
LQVDGQTRARDYSVIARAIHTTPRGFYNRRA